MIIYHYACPGKNVGDNALILGLKNSFREFGVTFQTHNLWTSPFTREYIAKINREAKAVMIGGGGLLHCSPGVRKRTSHNSGTLIRISPENVKLIKVPLIVYGVGYNVFYKEATLPPIAKKAIVELINRSIHFSVRNDGSRDRLVRFLGASDKLAQRILEVPDPGLWVPSCNEGVAKWADKESRNIAIQVAADRLNFRLRTRPIHCFVSDIIETIGMFPEFKFWIVPHTNDDLKFMSTRLSGTRATILPLKTDISDCSSIMGLYGNMRAVIGQRGHANICSFGLGIPTISISSHPKNSGFMKNVGLSEYCVDIEEYDFQERLISVIEKAISMNKEERGVQKDTLDRLRKETKEVNASIVKAIS